MQKPNSILMNSYTTQILIKSPIMPQKICLYHILMSKNLQILLAHNH